MRLDPSLKQNIFLIPVGPHWQVIKFPNRYRSIDFNANITGCWEAGHSINLAVKVTMKYFGFWCFEWQNVVPARQQRVVICLVQMSTLTLTETGRLQYSAQLLLFLIQRLLMYHNTKFLLQHSVISEATADLENWQITSRIYSPYNSPDSLVQRPDGRWHLRTNYQCLNTNTAPVTASVLNFAYLSAALQATGHPQMAALHVKDLLFTGLLQENDKEKLAFTWKGVPYTFNRLAFWSKFSPTSTHAKLVKFQSRSFKMWNCTYI